MGSDVHAKLDMRPKIFSFLCVFQRGDIIEIIAMNPSGLWQGKSQGRVGHFKFINVELLPDRNTLRQQRRSASEKVPNYTNSGPPKTVEELLKRIGLEVSKNWITSFYIFSMDVLCFIVGTSFGVRAQRLRRVGKLSRFGRVRIGLFGDHGERTTCQNTRGCWTLAR